MLRHLFTLIWNRKRANALLIVEIFLAFVVLFAVGSVGVFTLRNYRTPLGFAYENVWQVNLNPGTQPRRDQFGTLGQVLQRLRATPGVELVARTNFNTPFAFSTSNGTVSARPGSPEIVIDYYQASQELREVLGLHLQQGRWFDRRDDATTHQPVVLTDLASEGLFPGQSAVGKRIGDWQVVGVVGPYHGTGVLSEARAGVFFYVSPQDTNQARSVLLVRTRPGAGAALEKKLNDDIRATGPTWTSSISPMAAQRATQLRQLLPLPVLLGVVCVFLLVNVALGLFGVLWLNISQRRAELGVRRALGATAGAISRQVLGEILVLTTFGLLLGLAVAAQFPLLGVFSVKASVYGTAMALAAAGLYLLATVCALYPSRLAAGIHPAVALREE